MTQTTLVAFSIPQTPLPLWGINSCTDCVNRRGPIQVIGGKKMVRCLIRLREFREKGCAAWSDGNDWAYYERCKPPAGFVPKKWRGQQK